MSQKRQSSQEQIFAESAAKFLGENWTFFEPRPEAPDFIVDDGRVQFGLEITQIFKGDILPNGGSSILRAEGERQKLIDKTRISYEKKCAARLSLRILGKIDQATLEQIEQELISAQFDCLEIGTRRELNFNNRTKVFATKAFANVWFCVGDRIGWGGSDAHDRIQVAIDRKKAKLESYRAASGPDMRLLIVADHHFNSGMLEITSSRKFEFSGFSKVYFLAHPSYALELQMQVL